MKKSMILQIFSGKRGAHDQVPVVDKDYLKEANEVYEKMEESLSKEQFDMLNDFIKKDGIAHCVEMDAYFLEGFKIGLRIGVECMDE